MSLAVMYRADIAREGARQGQTGAVAATARRLARERGARVILLDNELWPESPYRPVLKAIAADLQVPLVDSLKLVADAATNMARDLEVRLGLTRAEQARGAEPVGSAQAGQAVPPLQAPPARR